MLLLKQTKDQPIQSTRNIYLSFKLTKYRNIVLINYAQLLVKQLNMYQFTSFQSIKPTSINHSTSLYVPPYFLFLSFISVKVQTYTWSNVNAKQDFNVIFQFKFPMSSYIQIPPELLLCTLQTQVYCLNVNRPFLKAMRPIACITNAYWFI